MKNKYKAGLPAVIGEVTQSAEDFMRERAAKTEARRKKAWRYAYEFCYGTPIGVQAANGSYWSLLFGYVFDEAFKTHTTQEVTIPNELIERWKRIGAFVLKRELSGVAAPRPSRATSPHGAGIDKYLDKLLGG